MITEPGTAELSRFPVISVRGEAHVTVEPDQVTLHGQLNVLRPTGPEALNAAAVAVDTMKAALTDLGGVALDATTTGSPLTWLVRQVHTRPEGNPRQGPTGNMYASVQWQVGLRDFTKLAEVQAIVEDPNLHHVHQTIWHLDRDNPAWAAVRADAVIDALRRGREYAAALASQLVALLHLADVGLLGGEGSGPVGRRLAAMAASGGAQHGPSLDPVPQEVSAVVEARFSIAPVDLALLDTDGSPVDSPRPN